MKKILCLLLLIPFIGKSQIVYNCCANIPTPTTNTSPLTFVDASTTGSLIATYSSNTLTAISNGRLANQDGIKLNVGDVLLVKDQNNAKLQNGEFYVADTGTTISKYSLVRPDYYDTATELYPSQVNVLRGTTNGGKYYLQTTVFPNVGTDPIVYIVTPAPPAPIYPLSFVDVRTGAILPNSPIYAAGTNTLLPAQNATYSATTNGVFPTLQGVSPASGLKVLVNNQVDQTKNGDYVITSTGSATSKWKITRISYTQSLLYPHLWEVLQGTDKGFIYQQNNKSLVNTTIGSVGNITFTNINPTSTAQTTTITAGSNIIVSGTAPNYTVSAPATSGVWSIKNSSGAPTYYATLTLAMSAASPGDVIEMNANVTESANVTIVPKDGVTLNTNGYTYTLAYSGSLVNAFDDGGTNPTFKIVGGGTIQRTVATGYAWVQGGALYANNCLFKSTVAYPVCVFTGNTYNPNVLSTSTSVSAGGIVNTGTLYYPISTSADAFGQGAIYTSGGTVIGGSATNPNGYGIQSAGAAIIDGVRLSGSYGAYGGDAGTIRNCIVSGTDRGIDHFTNVMDCDVISVNHALGTCINVSGGTYKTTTGISAVANNCTNLSSLTLINLTNDAAANGANFNGTGFVQNVVVFVTNSSANALYSASAQNIGYSGLKSNGAGTPVHANITQTSGLTDLYGNNKVQ